MKNIGESNGKFRMSLVLFFITFLIACGFIVNVSAQHRKHGKSHQSGISSTGVAQVTARDCRVVKLKDQTNVVLCRKNDKEDYHVADKSEHQSYCNEKWREVLKPYAQSGRPPANILIEGCEGTVQPRFTFDELRRP
jgi:hypothetical protein